MNSTSVVFPPEPKFPNGIENWPTVLCVFWNIMPILFLIHLKGYIELDSSRVLSTPSCGKWQIEYGRINMFTIIIMKD